MGETDELERCGSQECREDGQSHGGFETAKPEVSPAGKESTCNAGDPNMIPGLGRSPGGGHGDSFLYSSLENPTGHRSLVGCSPWGCKELDMTEQLSTQTRSFRIRKEILGEHSEEVIFKDCAEE